MTAPQASLQTQVSGFEDIGKTCYAAMQSEAALALTAPYHAEELERVEHVLARCAREGWPIEHFIAVGGGNLRYMDVALRHCRSYTAIDPHFGAQLDAEKRAYVAQRCQVNVLEKGFAEVAAGELPAGRKLFFFLFNVFPYIDGALAAQRRLAAPGDAVIISSWNDRSFEARRLQQIYYDYLNAAFAGALSGPRVNGYIDEVEKRSASFCAGLERRRGRTTDILALQL
jgi:hypothetical protein